MELEPACRLGVFDAGIGGFPFAAQLNRRDPGVEMVYLGDAARRPYGPREVAEVAGFTREAERFFRDAGCAGWVVACYTASVALAAIPGERLLPRIDMVGAASAALDPARQPSAGRAPDGETALMATAATVAAGVLPGLLPVPIRQQLATEELLRLAEADGGDDPDRLRREALAAVKLLDPEVSTVLLACTDFTCVLDQLHQAAPRVRFVDPIDVAVDLALDLLGRTDAVGRAEAAADHELYLTGPHPVDVLAVARRYGLHFDRIRSARLGGDLTAPVAESSTAFTKEEKERP